MSSFTNALILRDVGDGKYWAVHEPIRYYVEGLGDGFYVDVPKGFVTDLTSIPSILRSVVSKLSRANAAAVVHDRIYQHPWLLCHTTGDMRYPLNRFQCDLIFLEAMRVSKVGFVRRRVLYYGVRVGGELAWLEHRRNSIDEAIAHAQPDT
jgi:hypothetical protein